MTEKNNTALWIPDTPQNTQMGLFKTQIETQFECQLDDYASSQQGHTPERPTIMHHLMGPLSGLLCVLMRSGAGSDICTAVYLGLVTCPPDSKSRI